SDRAWLQQCWYDRIGHTPPWGPHKLEDLVPSLPASLEALVNQGYGVGDIGNMFGLRSSRISRWLKRYGLRSIHEHSRRRAWSDTAMRFVPIAPRLALRLGVSLPQPVRQGISRRIVNQDRSGDLREANRRSRSAA